MTEFRVYIEETSVRLFSKTIRATTPAEADAFARAALEDDTWSEWDHSASDCSVEHREELTARLEGALEVRVGLDAIAAVVAALPPELGATLEYPGFIAIPLTLVHHAAFGLANGYWAGDLVTEGGDVIGALALDTSPTSADTPAATIAAAIATVIRTLVPRKEQP